MPLELTAPPEPIPDTPDQAAWEQQEQALLADLTGHAEDVLLRLTAMMRTNPIRALLLTEQYASVMRRFVAEVAGAYEENRERQKQMANPRVTLGTDLAYAGAGTATIMTNATTGPGTIMFTPAPSGPDLRTLTGAMRDARALGDTTLEQTLRDRLDTMLGVSPGPQGETQPVPPTPTPYPEPHLAEVPTTIAEITGTTV